MLASTTRQLYGEALADAALAPPRHAPDRELHAFLSLNAAYFLGPWLPARVHHDQVRRRAADLGGLAGLPLPADPVHATQLAQHVRELEAEFGAAEWIARLVRRTEAWAVVAPADWDVAVLAAAEALAAGDDGHALLLAHARRRLWELRQRAPPAVGPTAVAAARRRLVARAVAREDGHTVQVVEAILAELPAPASVQAALDAALTRLGATGTADRPHER